MDERQVFLQSLTKKLVLLTLGMLMILGVTMYELSGLPQGKEKPFLILLVFACGLLGGFVSIQQRLPKIELNELRLLSRSWVSITLIPINGGIFALVLMLMFAGAVIQGDLFPQYRTVPIHNIQEFYAWLKSSYPVSSTDVAKLLFWAFVAGFSERLVPQVIRGTAAKLAGGGVSGAVVDKPPEHEQAESVANDEARHSDLAESKGSVNGQKTA